MPGTGGASNAVPKQVADFVARPGAAVQVFQRQPGNANRFEVRATPAQMSQTFKDQALGLAQRNPDPRVAAAVGGLLNGPGLRNVQVRIQVERVGGQPQIRGLDVAARGTLPAMRLVVNRDGVMGLDQGGPRVAPPAPQPAAPAGVLRLGQAATPSGGLNVVLNNLAPTMNAFRGQPTPRTLNVATIGAKFDNALRAYASEFPRSLNNPQSNYNKAVDGLRRAGYDPATNLFSRPPQGNTDVRRTLIEAWQLLANQR